MSHPTAEKCCCQLPGVNPVGLCWECGKPREVIASNEQVLLKALKYLARHYVGQLENARERIIFLGGECDPVDVMESRDPHLKQVREVIASVEASPAETNGFSPVRVESGEQVKDCLICGRTVVASFGESPVKTFEKPSAPSAAGPTSIESSELSGEDSKPAAVGAVCEHGIPRRFCTAVHGSES